MESLSIVEYKTEITGDFHCSILIEPLSSVLRCVLILKLMRQAGPLLEIPQGPQGPISAPGVGAKR